MGEAGLHLSVMQLTESAGRPDLPLVSTKTLHREVHSRGHYDRNTLFPWMTQSIAQWNCLGFCGSEPHRAFGRDASGSHDRCSRDGGCRVLLRGAGRRSACMHPHGVSSLSALSASVGLFGLDSGEICFSIQSRNRGFDQTPWLSAVSASRVLMNCQPTR